MNATCKWYVSAANVDDGMFRDAVRKNITDKRSANWWLEHYADSRYPVNDSDPNEGMVCTLVVESLDDLTTAVRLMRTAQAYAVTLECSIETAAFNASASIGPTFEDRTVAVFPKAMDKDATFRLIADIEERCDGLREHVLTVKE